jgi:hypothetical protein
MTILEHNPALIKVLWDTLEKRANILEKYRKALFIKAGEELSRTALDPGNLIYQNVRSLIQLRNALVHAKPEWYDEQVKHQKIANKVRGKFDRSLFVPTAELFPQGGMSHGCAKWAVNSSVEFVTAFSSQAGLTDRFAKHVAQLNPSENDTLPCMPMCATSHARHPHAADLGEPRPDKRPCALACALSCLLSRAMRRMQHSACAPHGCGAFLVGRHPDGIAAPNAL